MTSITWLKLTDQTLTPGDYTCKHDPNLNISGQQLSPVYNPYELGRPANQVKADRAAKIRYFAACNRQDLREDLRGLGGRESYWHYTTTEELLQFTQEQKVAELVHDFWRPVKLDRSVTDTKLTGIRNIQPDL